MPPLIHSLAGLPEISRAIAERLCASLHAAEKSSAAVFAIALHGGRSAKALFEELARQLLSRSISCGKLHLFWGDERCVPAHDPESNYLIASEALIKPLGLPPHQVHRIRGEDDPATAARTAAGELRRILGAQPVLDAVLLGMGEDGHIASLFPGTDEQLANSDAAYVPVIGPKPPPQRISLAFPVIAAARDVYAIAAGEAKREVLKRSLHPGDTPLGRCIRLRQQTEIFTDLRL